MDGALEYFEILLLAMLAVFLIYRLGSVLGKRTGHEQRPQDLFGRTDDRAAAKEDNVVALPGREEMTAEEEAAEAEAYGASPVAAGIKAIRSADPGFRPAEFLEGAKMAFEMIVLSFAQEDERTLKTLLSKDVFQDFQNAIAMRKKQQNKLETTLVGVDSADLLEAQLDGSDAVVTVKFVSQQANVTYDQEGKVVDGDPHAITNVTDIWTFRRNTRMSDPNWALVATRSPN